MSDYLEEAKKELEFARKDTGGVTVAIACALVAIAERLDGERSGQVEMLDEMAILTKQVEDIRSEIVSTNRAIEFTKRQQTADMDRIAELERRFIYTEAQSGCPCGGMVEDCELCGGVNSQDAPQAEHLALKSRVEYLTKNITVMATTASKRSDAIRQLEARVESLEGENASAALTTLVGRQALKIEQLEARLAHIERRLVEVDLNHQVDRITQLEGR